MTNHFDALKNIRDNSNIEEDVIQEVSEDISEEQNESFEQKSETASEEILNAQDQDTEDDNRASKVKSIKKPIEVSENAKILNADKKIKYIVSGILLIFAFFIVKSYFFSDKFQIYSKDGNIYRLNKITGQLALISETRLVSIDEPNKIKELGLNKLKVWDKEHLSQLDGIDLNLKTNWRNNRLYYQFLVTPYTKRLKKIREGDDFSNIYKIFTIKLQDEDGFDILTIPVKVSSMTGSTDDKGKIYALSDNDSIECSYDNFKAIKNWTIEWNL